MGKKMNNLLNKKYMSSFRKYSLSIFLFMGIITGSIIGIIFKEKALILKPFGDLFLNLIFTILTPLIFVTVSGAISSVSNLKRLSKILSVTFITFTFTGLVASIIMLIVSKYTNPGFGLNISVSETSEIEIFKTGEQIVKAFTVSDFSDLLSRKNLLPLIIFAILFGLATVSLGEKGKAISNTLNDMSQVFLKLMGFLMYYAPIGLGAYFATLVAEYGAELIGTYAKGMLIYFPVSIIYFFVAFFAYSYYAGGMRGVKSFFKEIIPACITSFGTQSSVATLPANLEASHRIGIPKDIIGIVLPLGLNMHMDGSCMAAIFKISFLFGLYDIPFEGLGTYISAITVALLSGVVMAGIPGGGLMAEMLIISMYGFPPEAFLIIATIGYLVDAPATMLNATGDTVAAMIVTKIVEGKDWMSKKLT
jgi:Na+/H+-dicarboxylate symporter